MASAGPLQLLYLPLLWVGLFGPWRALAPWCAAALGALALLLWLRTLRHARALSDTPVARVASAPQGYVALRGRLKTFSGTALALPGRGLPCVWFRCTIEERSGSEWRMVERFASEESLVLDDGSGECLVFWEHAEWLGLRHDVTVQDDRRYSDTWLAPGDEVTALGELRTRSADAEAVTVDAEVSGLLAAWKQDRPTLLRRFDRNGDGEIDLEEWEQVRQAAHATVVRERAGQAAAADTHVLDVPANGRPFIIARQGGIGPARLFGLLAMLDVAVFFGALWWLARLWQDGIRLH